MITSGEPRDLLASRVKYLLEWLAWLLTCSGHSFVKWLVEVEGMI